MTHTLHKHTLKDLSYYMTDVHGLDASEWPCKADLISDIVSYGWANDCAEYLA